MLLGGRGAVCTYPPAMYHEEPVHIYLQPFVICYGLVPKHYFELGHISSFSQ